MKSYSHDLRKRVVKAVRSGKSRPEVAETFSISLTTLKRWLVLDAQGDLAPKPEPGTRPRIGPDLEPYLRTQVEAHPDAILDEHVELWAASQGQRLSRATMARTLIRLGYTRKKSA
jgi:transposase